MKKLIALMLAMLMALSLVACGGTANNDANTDGDTQDSETKKELVVGVSADYAPFEFMYPD